MPEKIGSKDIARTAGEPLNTAAAAKFIGMSTSWLQHARVTGDGPRYHKIGARVVYYRGDLETWRASKGYTSTAEYERKPSHGPQMKPECSDGAGAKPTLAAWLQAARSAIHSAVNVRPANERSLEFLPIMGVIDAKELRATLNAADSQ